MRLESFLASGTKIVAKAFAQALRPPPEISVSQAAEKYRRLTSKSSQKTGNWNNDVAPDLVEIMDSLSQTDSCREVVLVKAAQSSGTEILLNFFNYVVVVVPGPMMLVRPTSTEAKRFSKQRVAPMIEAAPELRSKIKDSRSRDSGNTTLLKEFQGGILVIAGANSGTDLRSMPVRFLALDEIDGYPLEIANEGDPVDLAVTRTNNFSNRKIFYVSTPTDLYVSRIWKLYLRSDQRLRFVPCPHCQHKQHLVWDQMQWETRKELEYLCTHCGAVSPGDEVNGTEHVCPECEQSGSVTETTLLTRDTGDVIDAWYECVSCEKRIDEHQKTWMFSNENGAEWVPQRPGTNRAKGYHRPAMYNPPGLGLTWKECAQKFVQAESDPELMRTFTNLILGLPYRDIDQDQPDAVQLREREEPYRLRTVPEKGLVLVASVDVQGNRLEAKLKAYGRGEESWLIDYQTFYGNPEIIDAQGGPWLQLTDWRTRKYPHAFGGELGVMICAIDSGYLSDTVYEYCRRNKQDGVFAIKGMHGRAKSLIGKATEQDVTYSGQTIKGGIQLFPIGVDNGKDMVYMRMRIDAGMPKAMHFPVGMPDDYYKGLTAEERGKDGKWTKKPGVANEPLDLEVYNLAAATRLGVQRMTPEKWDILEEKIKNYQPELFASNSQETTAPAPSRTRRVRRGRGQQ